MAHVPEPWRHSSRDWCNRESEFDIYIAGDHKDESPDEDDPGGYCTSVAIVPGNETSGAIPRETAERICKCVNACAGFPNSALVDGALARLIEKVNDLLDCLKPFTGEVKEKCVGKWFDALHETVVALAPFPPPKEAPDG